MSTGVGGVSSLLDARAGAVVGLGNCRGRVRMNASVKEDVASPSSPWSLAERAEESSLEYRDVLVFVLGRVGECIGFPVIEEWSLNLKSFWAAAKRLVAPSTSAA